MNTNKCTFICNVPKLVELAKLLLIIKTIRKNPVPCADLLQYYATKKDFLHVAAPIFIALNLNEKKEEAFTCIISHLNGLMGNEGIISLIPILDKAFMVIGKELSKELLIAAERLKNNDLISFVLRKIDPKEITEDMYLQAMDTAFVSGKFEIAQEYYKRLASSQCKFSGKAYPILIKFYSNSGQLTTSLEFFNQMRSKGFILDTSMAVNAIIECCLKHGKLDKAMEIFDYQKINQDSIDLFTYGTLIKGLCKTGKLEDSFSLLNEMQSYIKPDDIIFNTMIDGCSKNGKIKEAFGLLEEMKKLNIQADIVTYNSLLDACIRAKQIPRAWEIYDEIKKEGIIPDNFTYSTLFKGIQDESHQSELARALEMLQQLENDDRFQPDAILYNVLLDACVSAKMLNRGIELFERMGSVESKVKPDEISFNTIIKGCGQARDYLKAFEIFGEMKSKNIKPNEVTFNSLIDVCVRCGKTQRGWDLLHEMETVGLTPDNFTYSTLIKGMQSHQGNNRSDLEKAFQLLEQMKTRNTIKPDEILYNCLMDACIRFHDIYRAIAVYNEMLLSKIEPSAVTYGILIKAYGQAGELDNAFNCFKKMKDAGHIPNAVTYGCLIDACIKNGSLNRGLELYKSMGNDGVQPNIIIYTTLIKGFSKARDLKSALQIYEKMKSDGKNTPNNVTYNSLLDCCARCDDLKNQEKIFEEMRASGVEPDLITFSTMIKGYCKQGHLSKSFYMLEMMTQANIVPDEVLYNSLLDGCARSNEVKLGFKVFDSMQQKGIQPSNVTYSILIKLYGKAKSPEKAFGIIEDMQKAGIEPGPVVYTCLIKTCIKGNYMKSATEIYNKMQKNGVKPDSVTYSTLIRAYLDNKMITEAAELTITALRQKNGNQNDHEIYEDLMNKLLARGDADSAKMCSTICELMKNYGSTAKEEVLNKVAKWTTEDKVFRKCDDSVRNKDKRIMQKKGGAGHKENVNAQNSINPKSKFSAFIEKSEQVDVEKQVHREMPSKKFTAQPIIFEQKAFSFKNSKKTEQTAKENTSKIARLV